MNLCFTVCVARSFVLLCVLDDSTTHLSTVATLLHSVLTMNYSNYYTTKGLTVIIVIFMKLYCCRSVVQHSLVVATVMGTAMCLRHQLY